MTVSNIFEVISKGEPGNITNDTGLDDVIVTEHMIQENIEGMLPVVVESLGGWHEDASAVVNKIARQLGSHTGKEAEEPIRHFFQRLSLLLWRDDQCHAGGLAGDKPVLLLLLRLVGSGAECLGD